MAREETEEIAALNACWGFWTPLWKLLEVMKGFKIEQLYVWELGVPERGYSTQVQWNYLLACSGNPRGRPTGTMFIEQANY